MNLLVILRKIVCQEKLYLNKIILLILENILGQKCPDFFVGVKYVNDA